MDPGRPHRGGPRRASTCTAARRAGSCCKKGALAPDPFLDPQQGPGFHPKRTRIVGLYTDPPEGSTVLGIDELGPVIPRTFAPAPGWSADGHRIKNETDYGRGPEKTWCTAPCARRTAGRSP
jgi:hypothetical protein